MSVLTADGWEARPIASHTRARMVLHQQEMQDTRCADGSSTVSCQPALQQNRNQIRKWCRCRCCAPRQSWLLHRRVKHPVVWGPCQRTERSSEPGPHERPSHPAKAPCLHENSTPIPAAFNAGSIAFVVSSFAWIKVSREQFLPSLLAPLIKQAHHAG